MKKIILMVIAMVMTFGVSELSAATKEKKVDLNTTQFITDINCDQCTKKIMNYIPNQKGVKDVEVDLRSKIVTVVYDADKTKDATLIKKFDKIDINAKVYDPKSNNKVTTSSTPNRTETTQSNQNNQNDKNNQTQSIQQDQKR